MICEFCAGETGTRRVRKQHFLDGKLYLVENVEAEVCPECGERYFHAATLDAADRIIRGKHTVKESLTVDVITV